jgi:multiple sugar transport system permease protein
MVRVNQRARRPKHRVVAGLARLPIYAVMLLVTVFTLGPFLWMLSGSFKTQGEIMQPGFGRVIPEEPTAENYRFLFERVSFGGYLMNTVFVASMTGLITTLVSAMGGYGLAKYTFRGRRLATVIILGTMLLPPVVLLAPLFQVVQTLRLIDSFWALILPGAASGFGVLIMRQYLLSVPGDLLDAGRIDGLSELRIFWSVVLPLVRPIVSALLIFTFLTAWNAYLWPMIVLRDEQNYLLTLAVTNVVASIHQQEYGVILAGTLIGIAPIIILFLALQREFISGLTLGAVKQ